MMKMKSLRISVMAAAIFMLLTGAASYATTSFPKNGDFSSGLNYWSWEGDVQAINEEAVLGDNGAFYSALYQGVALAQGTYSIDFDFQNGLSSDVPDGTFPDTVFNTVYFVDDLGTFDPYNLVFDDAIPLFDIDYVGVFNNNGQFSLSDKGDGWTHFSMMFTNMYAYVIPTFELIDGNFIDNDSRFLIDNVSVQAVPEPATVLLLASGLVLVGGTVRRRTRQG